MDKDKPFFNPRMIKIYRSWIIPIQFCSFNKHGRTWR